MNLENLFELQKKLDKKIKDEHNLHNKSLISKMLLGLQVELGELAKETRCFNFWSHNKPSEEKSILDEYIDCLYFALAIGIEKDFTDITVEMNTTDYGLTEQFLNLFVDINDLITFNSKDQYITLLENYLSLGLSLGFSEAEIEKAYEGKMIKKCNKKAVGC